MDLSDRDYKAYVDDWQGRGYRPSWIICFVHWEDCFLLIRPWYSGWFLPTAHLEVASSLDQIVNHLETEYYLRGLVVEDVLPPDTWIANARDAAPDFHPALLIRVAQQHVRVSAGSSWLWYNPYPREQDAEFLGHRLDRQFKPIRERKGIQLQRIPEQINAPVYHVDTNPWLWKEGDRGRHQT
ncbi:MAG: hypothetical protein LDL41_02235 [Coleofasciculus sp. S288]|nr:hypothetical protein [Coleofasciculus sp. S288]